MASETRNTSSSSKPRRAQDLLTCLLCSQYYEDPRQLPCGHTFCRKCLVRHHSLHMRQSETRARPTSDERRKVGLLPCPAAPNCLHVAVVPPEGVTGFPVDDQIARIKERVVSQMAEDILRRMPAGAGGWADDTMSTFSDASCETTQSAPVGNAGYDSGDDTPTKEFGPRGAGRTTETRPGNPVLDKYAKYFDDGGRDKASGDDGGSGAMPPPRRYTPGLRSGERRRVGYSSSFQHRRRRANVGSPTAFDDSSPVQELLRRQPSRCGSAPHLDDEKASNVRGVHLREPIRRNGSVFAERIRPTSSILEEIIFTAEESKGRDHGGLKSDIPTRPGDYSKFSDLNREPFSHPDYGSGQEGKVTSDASDRYYTRESRATYSADRPSASETSRSRPFSSTASQATRPENREKPAGFMSSASEPVYNVGSTCFNNAGNSASQTGDERRRFETVIDGETSYTEPNDKPSCFAESAPGMKAESSPTAPPRIRRKLPDQPVGSYADRISSKCRSAKTDDCSTSESSNGSSGRPFSGSIPSERPDFSPKLGRPSPRMGPRYQNTFRPVPEDPFDLRTPGRSDRLNQSRMNSNGGADQFLRPNASSGSTTPVNTAGRSPIPVRSARGTNKAKMWNPARSADVLWKYVVSSSSDSSDESDGDDDAEKTSKKDKGRSKVSSGDQQKTNGLGDSREEIAKDSADTSVNADTDKSRAGETQKEAEPNADCEKQSSSGHGTVVNSQERMNSNSANQVQLDSSTLASQPHCRVGELTTENGVNGHGEMARSTNVETVSSQSSDAGGPLTNGTDAPGETDGPKPETDFDRILRAARSKYSSCEPSVQVPKAVLAPVCREGIVTRWRMQRDDFAVPTSMTIASTGVVFVTDGGNASLDFVDEEGGLVHSITGMKPYSVASILTNGVERIYVGDRKSRTVRVFDADGCDVAQWDPETSSFGWIAGIASLKNGSLVIVDRERCKIGIYTVAGDRVSEFGAYGANDKQVCMADFVAVDSHDRVIVADSGNHCLKLFDPNAGGRPIARISQRGDADGFLHWPKGVAVDRRDNIVVADTNNNRVCQFGSDGRFVAHLLTETPRPYHVTVNDAGSLLGVTHFALNGFSQVDVYAMSDVANDYVG